MRSQYSLDYLIAAAIAIGIIAAGFGLSYSYLVQEVPSYNYYSLKIDLNGHSDSIYFPPFSFPGTFLCNGLLSYISNGNNYIFATNYNFLLPTNAGTYVARRDNINGQQYLLLDLPIGGILSNYAYDPTNDTLFVYLLPLNFNGSVNNNVFPATISLYYLSNLSFYKNLSVIFNGAQYLSINAPPVPFILEIYLPQDQAFFSECLQPSNTGLLLAINNTQYSLSTPFQQMISLSMAYNFINTSKGHMAQNVEFEYPNYTIINSWFEGNYSNKLIWWIKLPSLPKGVTYVFLKARNSSFNLFNGVTVGEAPQLSPIYGEYDDGANVFNYYWNFAGNTLPSGWTVYKNGGSGNYSVDNGLNISSNGNPGIHIIYTALSIYPNNVVMDMYVNIRNIYEASSGWWPASTSGWVTNIPSSTSSNPNYMVGIGGSPNGIGLGTNILSDNQNLVDSTTATGVFSTWLVGSTAYASYNYGSPVSINLGSSYSPSSFPYIDISGLSGSSSTIVGGIMYWLRIRAYPPNGVMPSVSVV